MGMVFHTDEDLSGCRCCESERRVSLIENKLRECRLKYDSDLDALKRRVHTLESAVAGLILEFKGLRVARRSKVVTS